MAWAWLGWLTITFLLVPTIWLVSAQRNWGGQHFDTWGHRTFHGDYTYNGNGGGNTMFRDKEAGIGGFGFSRQASRISGMMMPFGMGKRASNMDVLNITRPGSANNPKIQVSVRKDVESLPPPPPAFSPSNAGVNRPAVSIPSRPSPGSNASPISNRSRNPPEVPIGRTPSNPQNSPNPPSSLGSTPPLNISRLNPSPGQAPMAPPKNSILRGKGRIRDEGSVEPKPVVPTVSAVPGARKDGYF